MLRPSGASVAVLAVLALAACASTPDGAAPAATQPVERSTPFTLTTGSPRTPEQMAVRFEKADLAIRVRPDRQSIEATAVLDVLATQPVERLTFELDTRFAIRSIAVNGRLLNTAQWSNLDGRLILTLPETLPAGRGASVRIIYDGQPRTAPQAPWDGGFVWGAAPNGQPWIATALQGEGCDLLWPCIDHPGGEPARVELHITVPTGLMAPSNGRFVGSVDHGDGWTTWNWSARRPNTYAVALNIGPYVEMSADYFSRYGNTIPLRFWRLTSDDPVKAQGLFDQFPRMMDFYEATIGPFPFGDEKMGVVETPHLGMEHQTINAYGNSYRLDGKGYDWLLHHELAHEWFGNQMTNADYDDLWLHEGLGTYMQPLYARWLNGDRAMAVELSEMRGKLLNRFALVSGRPQDDDSVYDSNRGPGLDLYNKGALVAHSLRLLIGDRAFFETLRWLVYGTNDPRPGQFEPRFATTAEFEALASRAAGRDLGWFFQVYLHEAALPDLRQTRTGDRIVLEWITEGGRTFPMPVEVEIDGRVQTLAMTGGRGELVAPAGAHVLIDPDNKVLRRLDHIEAWQASRAAAAAAKPS